MKKTGIELLEDFVKTQKRLAIEIDAEAEAEGNAIKSHRGFTPRNLRKRGRVGAGIAQVW